jgi:hypothetical protein
MKINPCWKCGADTGQIPDIRKERNGRAWGWNIAIRCGKCGARGIDSGIISDHKKALREAIRYWNMGIGGE